MGAFPGSFNPPTVAHLAIADAARQQWGLDRVDLVVSRVALAKEHVAHPRLEDRVAVLERVAATRPWLGVVVTDAQLLADIAEGYQVLVLGADKWVQIQDPQFYGGSEAARDRALARLPALAVVPRPPHAVTGVDLLALPDGLAAVSSTAARAAARHWMTEEAAAFDDETGAWSDLDRYMRWCQGSVAGQGGA